MQQYDLVNKIKTFLYLKQMRIYLRRCEKIWKLTSSLGEFNFQENGDFYLISNVF